MTNAAPLSSHQHGPAVQEGGARVLVIDDSQTILKVVHTILERHGYEVAVARDGREGITVLNAAGPFDLILLDFIMPRMNGYQFCRELRADPNNKHMPVVLMSARTASIGDRFVEQTGAVDALGKPFDARALVAVVGGVLAKRAEQGAPVSMPSPDTMVDEEDLDLGPESEAPPSQHFRTLDRIVSQITDAIGPHLRKLRQADLRTPARLHDAIGRGIDSELLLKLVGTMDELDLAPSNEVLRGQSAKLPIAEVLQILQLRHQTGVITVSYKRKRAQLFVRDGMLDFARAEGMSDEFLLGRYFVQRGWLDREQLEEVVEDVDDGTLIGEWLVAKNIIDEPMLRQALAQQSAELTYETLKWPEGRFTLTEARFLPEAEKAQLGLGISELVLEGYRRVDEWRLMADTIDFNAVLVVDQVALGTVDDSKFGKNEHHILNAIDGKRPVREIMEESTLASFDAIKATYGLLQSRIVRELQQVTGKSLPPAAPAEHDADSEAPIIEVVDEASDDGPVDTPASRSEPGSSAAGVDDSSGPDAESAG